jgi:putative transposase
MTEEPLAVTGPLDAATEKHRQVATVRVTALLLVDRLVASNGSLGGALREVASTIGESETTIRRWRSMVQGRPTSEWAAVLLPRWRGRPSEAECSDEAWKFFLGAYLRPELPSLRDAYRRTLDVAAIKDWIVPSEKVMRVRLHREVPTESLVLRRRGGDALQSQYPAQQRDRTCFRALEAVNADGHRWDVQVRWPDGEIARPMAVVFQDLLSGKIVGWRVDRTENASAIRLAFGDMCEEFGIPDHCYLDNGRGFASKWMTGQMAHRFRFKIKPEEPEGIFGLLGVEVHWVTPYHGQAKPIERCFRDLCETIARHPSFSGAYTGNSPVTKPCNYGTRSIPLADFLKVVELEIRDHNARAGRQNRACFGQLSFDEAFARSYESAPVRKVTDEQRRLLLLAAEGLKVRQGGIHLLGNQFWCPEIAAHMGRSIVVRFDPEHVQRGVYVYDIRGQYLGFAECNAAVGFADADAAREHNRKRRSWTKAVKKATRELGIVDADEVGRMHIEALASKYGDTPSPAARVVRPVFGKGKRTKVVEIAAPPEDLARDSEQSAFIGKIGSQALRRLKAELA